MLSMSTGSANWLIAGSAACTRSESNLVGLTRLDYELFAGRSLVLSEGKSEAVGALEEWLDGQPPAEFDADSMGPHDGARVLFLERRASAREG